MGFVARGLGNIVRNVFSPPRATTNVTNIQKGSSYDDSALRGQLSTLQAQNQQLQQQAAAFGDWRKEQEAARTQAAQQRSNLTSLINQLQSSSNQTQDLLAGQIGGLQNQFGGLSGQLGGLEGQLGGLEGRIGDFRGDLTNTQSQLGALGSNVSSQIGNLSQNLSGQIGGLQNQFSGLGDTLSGQGDALVQLRDKLSTQGTSISDLAQGQSRLGAGYDALSGAQRNQIEQLYNLATQGQGVRGVKTSQGLTFTAPKGLGTGGLNRDALTFGSLNLA